jgi:hypothetical protein
MAAAYFVNGTREALREDGGFILFRSRSHGRAPKATVLLLAPVSARPSRESTQKLGGTLREAQHRADRTQAEQTLPESEERFHTLVHHASDGLLMHQALG